MDAEKKAEFAAILRSHVSVLAATKMEMPLGTWNDIANDFLEAADMIQKQPNEHRRLSVASHLPDLDEDQLEAISFRADLRAYYARLTWWQKVLYQFGFTPKPRKC